MTNKTKTIKRILCITLMLFVAAAFMPTAQTWAASKPAKPKVSVSVTSNSVTLSWKKAKGAKKYQIYRSTSKNGKYKKIKTTKKLSYKNTGLTKGKMYFYKVRSVSGKKKSKFRLSAAARSNAEFLCGGKFAISVVPYSMFKEYGADSDGVDDVVSALRDVDGVEIAIVLRELENGEIRANVRSNDGFNSAGFAGLYGGGGHLRAAGFSVRGRKIAALADEVKARVEKLI